MLRVPKAEPKVCSVPGCGRPHDARGFCNTHYQRWKKKKIAIDQPVRSWGLSKVFLLLMLLSISGLAQTPTPTPTPNPAPPPTIDSSSASANSITISFSDSSSMNGCFNIFRGTSPQTLGKVGDSCTQPDSGTFTDTGLAPGTTYFYQVEFLVSPGGIFTSFSSVSQISTLPASTPTPTPAPTPTPTPTPTPSPSSTPPPPSPVSATGVVTIAWTADPPQFNVTSYNVYYGTASGQYTTKLLAGNMTSVGLLLAKGITYYVAVTAVNASGESPKSSEISFMP